MASNTAPTVPHYEHLVAELIERHRAEMKAGGVYEVRVEHEDRCPGLLGTGVCDCDCVATLIEVMDPLRN